jgi:hypothetical protein
MPGYQYIHLGVDGATPLSLLVYTDPPFDVVTVDRGPHVCVRRAAAAPAQAIPYDVRAYVANDGEVRRNTVSREVDGA